MRLRFRSLDNDRGMALIVVMGTSLVLFILATVIVTRSLNDQRQVRRQRLHEQAIHVADAGLERGLYQLEQDATYFKGPDAPVGGFANVGAEKTWALTTAATAAAECPVAGPTKSATPCWFNGTEGQIVILKPSNLARVYSVSYVPTKAAPVRTRVIRGTFDTGNATLSYGILTGGNLTMGSGTTIAGSGVHANGNLTTSGGSVSGPATSSGSYTNGGTTVGAGSGGGRPGVQVPNIRPRDNYSKSEYDLCPDGTVRKGPSYTGGGAPTSTTPCTGTVLATATSTAYRGWRRTTASDASKGAIWTSTSAYDGVYYIYQGSALITGRVDKARVTVIAEATPASGTEPLCPRVGGDIEVRSPSPPPSMKISPAPKGTPFLYLAGRDLFMDTWWHHAQTQEGVMYATEQFSITGNNAGAGGLKLTGSIISGDFCHTTGSPVSTNSLTNVQLTYGGFSIPPGVPRLMNWAEI